MSQDQAFRQHIGDDLEPFERSVLDRDTARGLDLIFAGGIDSDLQLIGFRGFEGLVDPWPQGPQDLVLFSRREPGEDRYPVAKQESRAAAPDAQGERVCRKGIVALEAARLQPLAEQQRTDRKGFSQFHR